MNEIKLDKLNLLLSTGLIGKKPQSTPKPINQEEGVTVTNHMNDLVGLLSFGDPISNDNTRVLEMKQKIQSNDYSVDVNALAEKLMKTGALTVEG